MANTEKIYLNIDYEDKYVQPLLLAALNARLPPELLVFVDEASSPPPLDAKLLQWRQYENLDFEHLLEHPNTNLANSYVIRKALIRKHYLSTTVSHWLTKHPDSTLKDHVKLSVEFEVDYAEFLDDALVEAYELKESWARNEGKEPREREWWILKPGMSERGQGIRLFSSEEELVGIFEEWNPPSDDEEEADDDEAHHSDDEEQKPLPNAEQGEQSDGSNGVITSQLRHFVAQPYIHPPLLIPAPFASANRKFHIRTYVLAVGALKLYVYKPMLALFAGPEYAPPWASSNATSIDPDDGDVDVNEQLSAHLTNTCLQTGEREGSVHAFWSLPDTMPGLSPDWKNDVFAQILATTSNLFEAAAREMPVHFQPLPHAFEIFGLDFLVDERGRAWLLEVNAFPDFAQTGPELADVIAGLFEGVVDVAVKPYFGLDDEGLADKGTENMIKTLDIDLGRR